MIKNISLAQSEKLSLVSNLATMLTAGIPILETVDSLLEDQKGNLKVVLEALKEDLNQGKSIAFSFERFPKSFDPVIINLIKVAEEAGTLETTLKDLTENIKKDIEFSDKIKAALIYPALVVVVFMFVVIIILSFVIPRVSLVFTRLRLNLPLPTKILIVASKLFLTYTPFIVAGLIALVIFIIFLYKSKKKTFMAFLTSLPVIERLAQEIDLTRFTRSMSLLLSGGIPITEALELAQDVVNKPAIKKIIYESKSYVSQGKKLADSFKKSKKIIPSLMIRITEAGEKSGTLEKSMQDLSVHFDSQASNALKNLTSLFEPILLVIIGLLVGGVMLAIIAPIYGLIGQISAR